VILPRLPLVIQPIVIGNPLGTLGGTVTDGIISATSRELVLNNESMELIQTNATINSGNSGGGMFDGNGNLIGIVNAKDSGTTSSGTVIEGIGFAIPDQQGN
jgi:serine protease Do